MFDGYAITGLLELLNFKRRRGKKTFPSRKGGCKSELADYHVIPMEKGPHCPAVVKEGPVRATGTMPDKGNCARQTHIPSHTHFLCKHIHVHSPSTINTIDTIENAHNQTYSEPNGKKN